MPLDVDFTRGLRRSTILIGVVAACAMGYRASASELIIGRDAVQGIVVASLFKDQGKWNLVKGKCYLFLERPRTALSGGRVIIDAHLASRLGLEVGDSCLGKDFVSDVRLSGRFVGAGSQITLDDIRIDSVKDESTRQAVDLLQNAAGGSLPKSVNIDLLQLLKPTIVPGTPIKVAVTKLAIDQVKTQNDAVTVEFELKLSAL
jgi:hypothetical protein